MTRMCVAPSTRSRLTGGQDDDDAHNYSAGEEEATAGMEL